MPEGQKKGVTAAAPAPRAKMGPLPATALSPTENAVLWTCRAGFEGHLFEELAWASEQPRALGAALIESRRFPARPPAFGRMGFTVERVLTGTRTELAASAAKQILSSRAASQPFHLQVWAPDLEGLAGQHTLARELLDLLRAQLPAALLLESPEQARLKGGALVQLCCLDRDRVAVGPVRARDAVSLGEGGRRRMQRTQDSASRAAMKLEEALDWMALEPGKGEQCVDLGAAPGGWTERLISRGARVVAVDPAKLLPALANHRRVTHIQQSAFAFEPEEPADWLFCDMAWRPLEVAQLLAKWARRDWALHLVANIKLPMKDKNPILRRVRELLEGGGWREVRMRQLYHDRDEVTVLAVNLPG